MTGELVGRITLEKYQTARADPGFFEALLPQALPGCLFERFKGGVVKHASGERFNVCEQSKSRGGKANHCILWSYCMVSTPSIPILFKATKVFNSLVVMQAVEYGRQPPVPSSTLVELTTRLDFFKERRSQLMEQLHSLDLGHGPAPHGFQYKSSSPWNSPR